jgi:hypothetical protein
MACALIAPLPAALGLSSNLLLLPLAVVLALPALAALPRSTTTRENEERR